MSAAQRQALHATVVWHRRHEFVGCQLDYAHTHGASHARRQHNIKRAQEQQRLHKQQQV
jgi:hypothetical protein